MSSSGDASQRDSIQLNASGQRRSRSGCMLCRARKVKCDEKWPTCLNCERLKLGCPGPPGRQTTRPGARRSDAEFTQAGTVRQRAAKSCLPCRYAKTRCSSGAICTRCLRKGIDCSSTAGFAPSRPGKRKVASQRHVRSHEPEENASSQQSSKEVASRSPPQPSTEEIMASISWLYTPELPNGERLWTLVEEYFAHVHPIRCFGFIHKPSFMQRLDEGVNACRTNELLLHVICAFGAKFLALNYASQLPPDSILRAGNQWAKIAKARVFVDLDDLSIEKLMTAILLYDHDLRVGNYASAFMLSGMTARMSQALQLNLENSADTLCIKPESSVIANEVRRRLMWSCYVMDSWVGSGVNQLTLLEDRDVKIQLPCHSHNFSLAIPCITEILDEGKVLSFLSNEQIPSKPFQNMGIEAYFIRLVSSRKKVLQYVKELEISMPPWQSDSEFLRLSAEFDAWHRALPQNLSWSNGTIYAPKDSSQLGALTLLWCTFHHTLVDLYRIGMPTLFRIQKSISFPPGQQEFRDHCRKVCYENARRVSNVISEALQYGIKTLADTWICIIAHDSAKVMLYYLKLYRDSPDYLSATEVGGIIASVQKNLEALLQMRPMVATAEHCSLSVIKMMAAAEIQPQRPFVPVASVRSSNETHDMSPAPGSPIQESPENVLNPLAIYRMARTALHEKQTQSPSSNSSSAPNMASLHANRFSRSQATPQLVEGGVQLLDQQQQPNSFQGDDFQAMDHFYQPVAQSRDDAYFMTTFSGSNAAAPWDPADLAVMDILDGGIAPWTADYLTDSQSGVDPFLFPF